MADCNERVYRSGAFSGGQCANKAKHDEVDGKLTKCGTHSMAAEARRKVKRQVAEDARTAHWARRRKRQAAEDAVPEVAAELLAILDDMDRRAPDLDVCTEKLRDALEAMQVI